MGKAVKSIAGGGAKLATGGLGLATGAFGLGSPKDLLFGADQGTLGVSPLAAPIIEQQKRALDVRSGLLGDLEKEYKSDPSKLALSRVTRAERALSGAAEDTRRQLRERLAQRGIRGSSLGLSQELGIGQRLAEQQLALRASLPEQIEAIRQQRRGALAGFSGDIVRSQNVPVRFEEQRLGRSGGLLPGLLGGAGAAVGGMFGGGPGAMAGANIGSSLGGGISGTQKYR